MLSWHLKINDHDCVLSQTHQPDRFEIEFWSSNLWMNGNNRYHLRVKGPEVWHPTLDADKFEFTIEEADNPDVVIGHPWGDYEHNDERYFRSVLAEQSSRDQVLKLAFELAYGQSKPALASLAVAVDVALARIDARQKKNEERHRRKGLKHASK